MKTDRIMMAATVAIAALLLGVGQLAAQQSDTPSAGQSVPSATIPTKEAVVRVLRLKAADPKQVIAALQKAFAGRGIVLAWDSTTGSLVVRAPGDVIEPISKVVRVLDSETARRKRLAPDEVPPVTVSVAGVCKIIIDGQGYRVQAAATTATQQANPRPIRVAVFDFDVLKGVDLEPAALTDQVNTMLAAMDKVTIVNRDQIKKVADEHKMALSGLVDTASAAQLGKFLAANYVIVGRASKIGQTNYLVLKMIDVGTTVQTTVSAKAATEAGLEALLERLKGELAPRVRELQKPQPTVEDAALAKVRQAAKLLAGKVILVDVSETHVNRPLADPAAQMAIANRLKTLGIEVIVPKDPVDGWKRSLLETGRYGNKKVDFLLEGEGTSAYAAEMQGMISCRARVELRLIAVPGRNVTITDRGVAARVDLVESLAAKAALEGAGANALDAVILQHAKAQGEKK